MVNRFSTLERVGNIICWHILDANEQHVAVAQEDSQAMALLRRFLSNLIPQSYHILVNGSPVAEIHQTIGETAADGTAAITISTAPGDLPGGLAGAELPWFVAVDPATGVIVGVKAKEEWLPFRAPDALRLRMLAEEEVQMAVEFTSCGNGPAASGARLPVGHYDVYVLQALQSEDGASRCGVGGPSRLTIEDRP